jgi:hypothetical protein
MSNGTNSEIRDTRERRQWFLALAFGVNGADAAPPEPPAPPGAWDVLP